MAKLGLICIVLSICNVSCLDLSKSKILAAIFEKVLQRIFDGTEMTNDLFNATSIASVYGSDLYREQTSRYKGISNGTNFAYGLIKDSSIQPLNKSGHGQLLDKIPNENDHSLNKTSNDRKKTSGLYRNGSHGSQMPESPKRNTKEPKAYLPLCSPNLVDPCLQDVKDKDVTDNESKLNATATGFSSGFTRRPYKSLYVATAVLYLAFFLLNKAW